jgi:hypothetical protein
MLSCKELHFAIETDLHNLGAFQYGDFTTEEIDYEINQEVARIIRELPLKKDSQLNSVEKNLITELTKTDCTVPTKDNNLYKVVLPTNYSKVIRVQGITLDKNCLKKVDKIEENKFYFVNLDTLYNGIWYKKCDTIKGTNISDFYGDVSEIKQNTKVFAEVKPDLAGQFSNTYSIVGNNVEINSTDELLEVCVTYISGGTGVKTDCCNNITLALSEDTQRFVIDRVVKRIAIVSEQNQNKINNLNIQNREQI